MCTPILCCSLNMPEKWLHLFICSLPVWHFALSSVYMLVGTKILSTRFDGTLQCILVDILPISSNALDHMMFLFVVCFSLWINVGCIFSDNLIYYFLPEGNIFTWGWGGSHGTFSEDGHSSGGQLVCFQLSWIIFICIVSVANMQH